MEDGSGWTFRGTAFVDYVAVEVEVRIFTGQERGTSILAFSHTTARDAVRFACLVQKARAFVGGCSLAADGSKVAGVGFGLGVGGRLENSAQRGWSKELGTPRGKRASFLADCSLDEPLHRALEPFVWRSDPQKPGRLGTFGSISSCRVVQIAAILVRGEARNGVFCSEKAAPCSNSDENRRDLRSGMRRS